MLMRDTFRHANFEDKVFEEEVCIEQVIHDANTPHNMHEHNIGHCGNKTHITSAFCYCSLSEYSWELCLAHLAAIMRTVG